MLNGKYFFTCHEKIKNLYLSAAENALLASMRGKVFHIQAGLRVLRTVGDLLIWLNEREKLLAMESRSFVGYNELTLFAIYLVKNPIWKKMMASDGVWIDDDDLFERVLKDQEAAFAKRKDLFGGYDFVNKLERKDKVTRISKLQSLRI